MKQKLRPRNRLVRSSSKLEQNSNKIKTKKHTKGKELQNRGSIKNTVTSSVGVCARSTHVFAPMLTHLSSALLYNLLSRKQRDKIKIKLILNNE